MIKVKSKITAIRKTFKLVLFRKKQDQILIIKYVIEVNAEFLPHKYFSLSTWTSYFHNLTDG